MITSLAVAMALGILPMVSIGVLAPFLIDDLEISRADLGLLVAVVAGISAVLSPSAGALVDRIGDRGALLAVLGTGALSLGLMAAASSFLAMSCALALAGLCRSAANPATNRLISFRLPRGRRGWITGVKQSGETVAMVLAAAVLPTAAVLWGWRVPLLLFGLAAALTLVGAALSIKGTHRMAAETRTPGRQRLPASLQWLNAYNLVMGAGTGAIIAYLPLYAHQIGGLSDAAAGGMLIAAGVTGGVSRLLWSHWSEARWGFPVSLSGLAAVAVVACAIMLAAPEIGLSAYWLGAAVWGIGGLGFGAVSMLAAMAEADDASTGRASGLVVFWFSLGFTVAPPAFGWLLDYTNSYAPGLACLAGLYATAGLIMATSRGSFRPLESAATVERR